MIRRSFSAAALAILLGGAFVLIRSATAQWPGLQFDILAAGYSPERQIRIHEKGPSDILYAKLIAQPGSDTGWHSHPGSAIALVASGAVTQYHSNGCITLQQAGSVFFEHPGEVHKVINHGSEPAVVYMTFILPTGTQPLQPEPEPSGRTCSAGGRH